MFLVVLSSLTAPALAVLYRSLLGSSTWAMGAGLVWAFLPVSRQTAGLLLGEPLAALLLVLALLLTVHGVRNKKISLALLAGGLFGYAVLTRAYLALTWVAPVVWLWRRGLRRLALALSLGAVLIVGGWAVRNWSVMGVFTVSTQTIELWEGNNAWARGSASLHDLDLQLRYLEGRYPGVQASGETVRSRIFLREAAVEVIGNPGRFLWLAPRKLALFVSPYSPYLGIDWLYAVLLPPSVLGMWMLTRDGEKGDAMWLLGGPIAAVAAICLLTFGDPRFRHPVEPFLLVTAARCVSTVCKRMGETVGSARRRA
jgi:hypothetical protein